MRPDDLLFTSRSFEVPAGRAPVHVTWLGTAGFAIEHDGYVVLIDPYLTRAPLWRCAAAPLKPDLDAVARYTPEASAIVAGHTHFDHVLDVPAIAQATGATVYGSTSCASLCRVAGVDDVQIVDVQQHTRREPFRAEVGPFELRFVPSVHSQFALGRVPFEGDISDCDQVPMRTEAYRCGAVFAVDIRVAGRRIYHLGSADLLEAWPEPGVDLLLMCVAGWTTTPRFAPRLMRTLQPGAILLSHWDNFFRPMEDGARMLPAMQLPRLVEQLSAMDRSVRIGALRLLGSLAL